MKLIGKKAAALLLVMLLLSVMTVGTLSVQAEEDVLKEGPFTYVVEEGAVTITDCDIEAKGKVEIPSTIADYPVTAIASFAFYGISYSTQSLLFHKKTKLLHFL